MAGNNSSTSSALLRKQTDSELMPPPPVPKPIKRPKTVLDEDTYAEGLSKIIARDFFPGLVESETQNEYLDALDSKDQAWINSAGQRVREAMTPGRQGRRRGVRPQPQFRSRSETPSAASLRSPSVGSTPGRGETPRGFAGETPASVRSDSTMGEGRAAAGDGKGDEKSAVSTDVSLGAFQAKYTSEDNESFHKLLDRQNQKRAEKHAWLWNGNKLPSKMQIKQRAVQDRLLDSGRQSLVDDGYGKRDRLAISDRADHDRPAAPDSWKFQAKSALMFHPDGVDDDSGIETVAHQAQAASRAPPKSIVYANTRLLGTSLAAEETAQENPRPPSPTLSAVRDALAGRPQRSDRDSAFGSTVTGGETPRVNGYAFVDDEPEAEQPRAESAQEEEPIRFAPADATPNPFQLQAKSKREGLHHRMVERIAQSKRTSARVGMTGRVSESSPAVPYPSSPRVSGNLTPAGRRLWSKIGGNRRYDPVAAFNRSGKGPRNPVVGSRRARLKEQRSLYG